MLCYAMLYYTILYYILYYTIYYILYYILFYAMLYYILKIFSTFFLDGLEKALQLKPLYTFPPFPLMEVGRLVSFNNFILIKYL